MVIEVIEKMFKGSRENSMTDTIKLEKRGLLEGNTRSIYAVIVTIKLYLTAFTKNKVLEVFYSKRYTTKTSMHSIKIHN